MNISKAPPYGSVWEAWPKALTTSTNSSWHREEAVLLWLPLGCLRSSPSLKMTPANLQGKLICDRLKSRKPFLHSAKIPHCPRSKRKSRDCKRGCCSSAWVESEGVLCHPAKLPNNVRGTQLQTRWQTWAPPYLHSILKVHPSCNVLRALSSESVQMVRKIVVFF